MPCESLEMPSDTSLGLNETVSEKEKDEIPPSDSTRNKMKVIKYIMKHETFSDHVSKYRIYRWTL